MSKHRFRFFGMRQGEQWNLNPDDALHASRVLRLTVGDEVEITDGEGIWGIGTLVELAKNRAVVRCSEEHRDDELAPLAIIVGALQPKNAEDIISPLVELGVSEIRFFGQSQTAKFKLSPDKLAKLERQAIEALKQSKGSRLPKLSIHNDLEQALQDLANYGMRIALSPDGKGLPKAVGSSAPQGMAYVIGSESGFTKEDIATYKSHNFQEVRIARRILRAKTACVVAAGLSAALTFYSEK